jgi:uncharacterized protein
MKFEWDDAKAAANRRKHGVSFEEAKSLFKNPLRIDFDDFHSVAEDRYIAVGVSSQGRRLFVSHVYRDGRIRIIMARLVTQAEWNRYVQGIT